MKKYIFITILLISSVLLSCKTDIPLTQKEPPKKEETLPPNTDETDKEENTKPIPPKEEQEQTTPPKEEVDPPTKEEDNKEDVTIPEDIICNVELKVDNFFVIADGKSSPKFSVYMDGTLINSGYEIYISTPFTSPVKVINNTFTCNTPAYYQAQAFIGKNKSDSIPLIFTSDENNPYSYNSNIKLIPTISGNSIIFTVEENGLDITQASSIYKVTKENSIKKTYDKLNGNEYTVVTNEDVTYTTFIAVVGNKVSYEHTVINENLKGPKTVFAKGVSLTDGWYDVNKKKDGRSPEYGDAVMCWAASSSNIIQWYQDRYVARGKTLPDNIPNKQNITTDYELSVFDLFRKEWDNTSGGQMEIGVQWYFGGVNNAANITGNAVPKTEGNYFPEILNYLPSPYSNNSNASNTWGDYSHISNEPIVTFSNIITNTINKGIGGLTIQPSGVHHAITLWGYDINDEGIVTALYVTDSDDLISTPSVPRSNIMHHLKIIQRGSEVGFEKLSYIKGFCPIASIISFSDIQ